MKFDKNRTQPFTPMGIKGLLYIAAFFPLILIARKNLIFAENYLPITISIVTATFFILSAKIIFNKTSLGKLFAILGCTGSTAGIFLYLKITPVNTLISLAIYTLAIYFFVELDLSFGFKRIEDRTERVLQQSRWAAKGLVGISLLYIIMINESSFAANFLLLLATIFNQYLTVSWAIHQQSSFSRYVNIFINTILLLLSFVLINNGLTVAGSIGTGAIILLLLPRSTYSNQRNIGWLEPLLNHPARLTLTTFLILCILGTILLAMPSAGVSDISLIDSAFTSVSAVCVTGLIVLDTPNDFTFTGQLFILILIQLGGLGIMTVSTVALHALGHKLSLKHEKLLNLTYNSDYQNLSNSVLQIVKFTFVLELLGALILTLLFYNSGLESSESLWKGIFTSISAFCNAGFALQSDSFVSYNRNPAILHTIAFLIVAGGTSPALALIVPSWLTDKKVSVAARLALITTLVLLIGGTFFFLAFEWNHVLAEFSFADKLHNAWFQSVTLRTAGFNSIVINNVFNPTLIIMICMMFIGGNPGGTAGGVKTTTVAVMAVTFWSSIMGYNKISIQNRRIMPQTVYKAATTIGAGILILLCAIIMLLATQAISTRELIFEAGSALGTVGLSCGATTNLDNIGKIIIMFTMFAGRIGPVTLFTLLSKPKQTDSENLLEARINLS
ncbi:MAG: TrkH family potassium uptake protein [Candidatus Rifleibacteriota bacterium]